MGTLTDTVSSKVWLAPERGLKIGPLEAYTSTFNIREQPVPHREFYELLMKTSVLVSRKPVVETEFDMEFQAWETLSDEALEIFERELG
jgi:hypothetical protein